jgi:putative transposase
LLKAKVYSDHLRCLLSLRPNQPVSKATETIKTNTARILGLRFGWPSPVWGRGALARSIGRVRLETIKTYIHEQSEHHGYTSRIHPPVARYRARSQVSLKAAHTVFELNHHLVVATRNRRAVFDSRLGESLIQYWLRVAEARGFAIDSITILPDHAHLLVRIAPKISVEEAALSLLNNGQHFVGQKAQSALIEAGIDQLWQPSAYVGTSGKITIALLNAYLSE